MACRPGSLNASHSEIPDEIPKVVFWKLDESCFGRSKVEGHKTVKANVFEISEILEPS